MEITELLKIEFGLNNIALKQLEGYDNTNFLVETSVCKYVFKTYPFTPELLLWLEGENEALLFLNKGNMVEFPLPIQFVDENYIKVLNINGRKKIARLLSYVDGEFIGGKGASKETVRSLGVRLAELNLKLKKFTNSAIMSKQWEWDIQYFNLNKKYISAIPNAANRAVVTYFFQQYEQVVTPIVNTLRKQIIHNDANEWNILTKGSQVSGLIDFGDIAYTYLINELAIAITYIAYHKPNPLVWAVALTKAYHSKLPLEEKEVKVLYYLVAARLCISVCNSAKAAQENPENSYATSSEEMAWSMLHKWLEIGPVAAENAFGTVTGYYQSELPTIENVLARRNKSISTALSVSYKVPIYMKQAAFQYMYDAYGHSFLDAYNNIPHVGHSHPKVVAAGQKQMARLNTNTRYLYDELAIYAERLLQKFPPSLNKVFFVNSGSAASDLAIRMAKSHTKKNGIMVMEHGYHGNTQTSIDISEYKFNNPKGQGQKEFILKATIPDTFNGEYRDESAGYNYANDAIQQLKNADLPVAAFISEPVVGCGGQVPLAKGYLEHLYPAIRAHGAVCISDEVQTGFGRLGDHFWGFEAQNVIPDMVIVGKPMANGHPMGAVICTEEIANSFAKGVEFFSSFGGNPVSCAIATAVLEVIEEEKLQENAKIVGDYYKQLLSELKDEFNCIGDVRGSGLFLGIEIIDPTNNQPNTALAEKIKNELRTNNILISTDGPFDSVIKSKPPLCFTKANAERVVVAIRKTLRTS